MAIPPIKGQGLRGLVVSPEELFEDPSICASNRPSSEAYLKQEFESLNTGGDPDGPVAKLEGFKPSIRGSRENPPIMRYPQNIGSPDSGLPHVMQFKVYWRWENTELIMEQTKKLKAEAEAAFEQLVEATDLIANEDYNYENILAKSTSDVPTKLLFDPAFVDPKDPSSKRNLYTMLNNPETREEAKAIMERNVRSATDRTEYIGRLSANRDTSNNFGATDITRDDDVLSGRLNKSISGTEDQASIAGAAEALGLKQRDPQYDQMISVYLPICTRINSEDTFTYTDADMKLVGGVASAINSALGSEDFMGSLAETGKQAALGYASKLGEGTAYAGIIPNLTGLVLNPRLEKLFQQKDIRSFNFSWDMYPKNQEEVKVIQEIIQAFRYHSHPAKSTETGGDEKTLDPQIMLRVPAEFTIKFLSSFKNKDQEGFAENDYIPKISRCVLTSVSVDYTPNGVFSTLQDNSPTGYTLTLSFSEIAQLTREDVKKGY